MNKKRSLLYNVLFNNCSDLLVLIAPLITAPYISRVLTPDGVGIFSYSNSLVSYFTLFAGLGTVIYGGREISRNRDDKKSYSQKFWEIELITVITSLICTIFWLIVAFTYEKYQPYLLALTLLIVSSLFNITWLYVGLEKLKYTVLINSIIKIVSVVLIFILVKTENDLIIYTYIYAGSSLLGNLSFWIFLPKVLSKCQIEWKNLKKHFKETIVYFIPTIATTIYTVLDKTLIGLITNDDSQNGYYEQATKIINITKVVAFTSINGVVSSRISYMFKEKTNYKIKEKIRYFLDFELFLSIGAMFGLFGVAENFVPIFFGEGYENTTILLYLLAPIIPIICISNILGTLYYTPSGLRKKSAIYVIIGAVVNFLLNLVLIFYFQAFGAAVASLLAELVITILYIANCNKYIRFKDVFKLLGKKIIAGIFMAFIVYHLGKIEINQYARLLVQVVSGIILYIIILFTLNDDWFIDMKKGFETGENHAF